ncbi:lipopolysaccharide core heptose(II) kinase RfaY [Oceanihabitans sp. 2_MG-2023]|uniref:ABC1 kinase family protein n=1 Tax=Oceanihabitans sp. 2_MG-2023 TaxID=3062661 RepID=UPI0026E2BCF0|nr:lipopolysaccharide core heptose(II) kinase RfaY [Oceanihabitans sp. 2_MG-2023]MDO6596266.1 lipopolysaccharide core heptose(II) kinase RfaY [Oceanihabitans sp. 2_MG-2023]
MKTIKNIPISKIQRASKLVQTGAKVGVNYLKYFGDKMVNSEEEAKERLDESNATDIYDSLKDLKGSALKLAQMLSMEKNILPQAYVEKFSLSQFSVPPLSAPLVLKTFKKSFGQFPNEIFDAFNSEAINAASIGQVHKAEKDGKALAVKIQYPGVADSILSDLAMVKPIAMKMFNIKGEHSEVYFKEVEGKLLEETNYLLEIEQSKEVVTACAHIPNLEFPRYYEAFSSQQIITMDWMEGMHLSEFTKINTNPGLANQIGQALWDFYLYQMHVLKKVHADPHPGNFLISEKGKLIAIDFGCMKIIPEDFYFPYFELFNKEILEDPKLFHNQLLVLEILRKEDTKEEIVFFTNMFHDVLSFFTQPFREENFDFSNAVFFEKIAAIGEQYFKSTRSNKMNANRGSKHFIYLNRTFFGLFNLMFDLKANNIKINNYKSL